MSKRWQIFNFWENYTFKVNHDLSVCFSASARLKTVDVLMKSLQAAESQVRKYESRLSEEDIVPADTSAIQALGEQLKVRKTDTHR